MRVKRTPSPQRVPLPLIANVPMPLTVTATPTGSQSALSRYVTEKVNCVVADPEPGEARPSLSVSWCDGPLQLAASVGDGPWARTAVAARMIATRRKIEACLRDTPCQADGPARCAR